MAIKNHTYILPVIVFSQFAGTSLWFAGNAVIRELQKESGGASAAHLTSFIQFGFITGTLAFAIGTIADRYRPTLVFLLSSCAAALSNALIVLVANDIFWIGCLRFLTGFFLAGIYPVGMKIAADRFPGKLGNALGFLVGALVLGTAFPHLLQARQVLPWKDVLLLTSLLALAGGLLLYATVPTDKGVVKSRFEPGAFLNVFRSRNFRAASFGYFGHMWELYTFWTFLPLLLQQYPEEKMDSSFWSFCIIAAGCAGCIAGGLISRKTGSRPVAFVSLLISFMCCVAAPFGLALPYAGFLLFLLLWGTTVAADSPQFSTLVAQSAPPSYKGTALTIVTSIGFFITIVSLQAVQTFFAYGEKSLWLLAPGPFFGLIALGKWKKN